MLRQRIKSKEISSDSSYNHKLQYHYHHNQRQQKQQSPRLQSAQLADFNNVTR